MRRVPLAAVAALCVAAAALAGDVVVPVAAVNSPGAYGNQWNTEVYLINPGPVDLQVAGPRLLPLRETVTNPCEPPTTPWVVPADSSLLVSAAALAQAMGCPDMFVGGLVFSADTGIVIQTRMVNTKGFGSPPAGAFLAGFGEEIPGIAASDLPQPHFGYMLPTLISNEGSLFDTYLYFANPNASDATVTLSWPNPSPLSIIIGGNQVPVPYTFTVPANGEVQLHPQSACCVPDGFGPAMFDLVVFVSEPVAVIGTVVDRASNDSRVVLPVPLLGIM